MLQLNISCTLASIPLEKKIHHQKRENGGGNSGNSQKLINYLRLQDWDVLGYAYALIIKRYFYKNQEQR